MGHASGKPPLLRFLPTEASTALQGPSSASAELAHQMQAATSTTTLADAHARHEHPASKRILPISQTHSFGRNNYKWRVTPTVSKFSCTPGRNMLTAGNPEPKESALHAKAEIDCFSLFMNDDMLSEIVIHSNNFISKKMQNLEKDCYSKSSKH